MSTPRYVIAGTGLLIKDGSFYTPSNRLVDLSGEDVDWLILTGAARPAKVGDVVTIDGLTLTVKAVVE
jgi:hypothetical protein